MKPRYVVITLALAMGVTTFLVPATSRAASPNKPNILFILTDDQNPDTLGCFGGKVLTPTLDKRHAGYWDADQLYDLRADPGERVNLMKDPRYAQTAAELRGRLKGWLAGLERPFGEFVP